MANSYFEYVLLANQNHCYMEWNECLNHQKLQTSCLKLIEKSNSHHLEVVGRGGETELHVGENLNLLLGYVG